MKVFYKGKICDSVIDGLTVEDVNELYGGFGEEDCYLPACETYCLINEGDGVIIPEVGCLEEDENVPEIVDLGDIDIDLSDIETLIDLLHMEGLLVGPVSLFLIDQPMDECDLIVDCKVSGASHSLFIKLCDSWGASKNSLKNKISDSVESYSKRPKKEFLRDSLLNKARLFKYGKLSKCYIKDEETHVTATTNEGNSMLTKFDANDADSAAAYLEANEGQKIVKSDENGIYIGNESIDETSVRDIQEVNDMRYSLKASRGVLDSFSKIFDKNRWSFVGDVRRGVPDFSHVEVVVDSSHENVLKRLKSVKGVRKIKDCADCVCCTCDGIPFEVYSAEGDSFIPALVLMTGTDEFNVMFLANAIDNGVYFTDEGVFDEEGESFSFVDEEDCFGQVGVEYVEPTKRNFF